MLSIEDVVILRYKSGTIFLDLLATVLRRARSLPHPGASSGRLLRYPLTEDIQFMFKLLNVLHCRFALAKALQIV